MNAQAHGLWRRALKAIATAEQLAASDPDAAANRAYYAAFHAVSALFALEDKSFSKHSAIEAAIHRDLINTGRWEKERGAEYYFLIHLRYKGDYGSEHLVSPEEADQAVAAAKTILRSVRRMSDEFD